MVTMLLLAVIYCAFISLGLPDSLLGTAWPIMRNTLQLPQVYAGILSFIIAGGTIISSLCSVRLIKRFRTEYVTVVSVVLTACALAGFSVGKNFVWLILCSIPMGLGAGSVDAALNNYVAVHFKATHMSWLHCFWGIGATLGPVIMSYFLADGCRWRWGYKSISIIQGILTVILMVSLPIWKKAAVISCDNTLPETNILSIRNALALPGAKAAFVTFFCYCSVEASTGLWGSSYLVLIRDIAPDKAAAWISIYYFGITFGRFLNGFVSMLLSEKQTVRIGSGILAFGIIVVFVAPELLSILVVIGFFCIGLGCAPIFPSLIHETPTNFGTANSQSVMGMQMACAYMGSTFMPPLFGLIAAHVSYAVFPAFLGIMLVILFFAQEHLHRVCKKY